MLAVNIFDIADNFDATAGFRDISPLLPQWRLDKSMSYRNDIDRFLCAKSFLILEEMLRVNFGLVHCPEFSYGSHGKPYFREYPGVFFNISHCHRGIACAVSDRAVGIDIEDIQYDDELARMILNQDELTAVRCSDDPGTEFTRLWTLKESFLKLNGEGLRDNMKDILSGTEGICFKTGSNSAAGYVCSTAVCRQSQGE